MGLLVSGTFPVWGSQNFDKLARILVVTRKEIYRTSRLSLQAPRPDVDAFQCWRDTYDPILIAGGSEGAILPWDIPNGRHLQSAQLPYHYFPSLPPAPRRQRMPHPRRPRYQPRNPPRATLCQPLGSNVWALPNLPPARLPSRLRLGRPDNPLLGVLATLPPALPPASPKP
jgi:hypothetical protein